jgi:hypothetical protein
MRLSNRQALLLYQIAVDSIVLQDNGQVFRVSAEERRRLVEEIIAQQDRTAQELGE